MARPRILVADDEIGMLRSVERVLAPQYEVRTTRESAQALEIARALDPDLAILDIRMPGMDGFELMSALKAQDPLLDVILMTGSVHETDARLIRAIREKAFYFLYKPFDRDVLLTLVDRCLELRRLADDNRRHVRRLETEMLAARAFQQVVLPPEDARFGGLHIAARCVPCVELSGDFFDYAESSKGAALVVADVAGHGAGAAMLTGMIKMAFHAAAVDDYAPSSVLARMAESVQRLEYDRFVTVLCVRVGSKDTLEYANAGHPSGFVLSKDHTIVDLPSTGTVVHPMLPERSWPSRTARFARGDRLVIYSDGLVEAMGKDGVYGVERLKRVVERQTGAPRDVVESIVGSVTAYVDGRPLDDDLTLLVAERARSPQRTPS
jgi:sigma-B regulation protein RsbU (phosphoserine phosphatase)